MASLPLGGQGGQSPDFSKLTDRDKQELQQFLINEAQRTKIQQAVHGLTDICFRKCVTGKMGNGKLDRNEEPCVQNCVERFLDANHVILRDLGRLKEMS